MIRFLAGLMVALAPACVGNDEADAIGTASQPVVTRADSLVSMQLARAVAETYGPPRQVVSSTSAVDSRGRVAMYGFNFRDGGWVIVGADFEYVPILAENDTGTIDVSVEDSAFIVWRGHTAQLIGAIRDRSSADAPDLQADIAAARELRDTWLAPLTKLAGRGDVDAAEVQRGTTIAQCQDDASCGPLPPEPHPLPTCHTSSEDAIQPKITSRWGQGCFYNKKVPADPIFVNGYCNRMPAGCDNVAAGQVMRFWKYNKPTPPWGTSSFDYAAMPDEVRNYTGHGETEVQRLMFWLGVFAHTTYAHDGSSTSDGNLQAALETFGFHTTYGSYSSPFTIAHQQATQGHPFLVGGDDANGRGHMWVADGTKKYKFDNAPCHPTSDQKVKKIYYHWGADGLYDGWYAEPSSQQYTHDRIFMTMVPQ